MPLNTSWRGDKIHIRILAKSNFLYQLTRLSTSPAVDLEGAGAALNRSGPSIWRAHNAPVPSDVIVYLEEGNRVLKGRPGGRCLRFIDAERCRLAGKAYAPGRHPDAGSMVKGLLSLCLPE
jgi:hypothetical protein